MALRAILYSLALALCVQKPAFAYIDPGTGSIILQAIIGGIAVAGFYFRSYLAKFVSLFKSKDRIEQKSDTGLNDN